MHYWKSAFAILSCSAFTVAVPTMTNAATCPSGYPNGPVTMQVGYSAGGGTDTVARKIAAEIEKQQGWTVVVQNKPGASGGVMATGVMGAPGNGQLIGAGTSTTLAIQPYKSKDTKYTYADFKYLGTGMLLNYGLVALTEKPFASLEEFVAYTKKKGRATVSVGSISYEIAVKTIASHYGVDLVPVPTKGSSRAMKDALGGHVDATVQGAKHVPQIRAGKMVQLATLTSKRAAYAPNVKTLVEHGVNLAIDGHIILFVSKSTPDTIQKCLSEAVAEATSSESYTQLMNKLETEASNLGVGGTEAFLKKMSAFYKENLSK